jgi:hypothetical protein
MLAMRVERMLAVIVERMLDMRSTVRCIHAAKPPLGRVNVWY